LGTRPADALGVKQELEKALAGRQADDITRPRERPGDFMSEKTQREVPQVEYFG
jgi:hypothetical protein